MRHIAAWTQESTYDETLSFIKELALSHAAEGGEQGKRIATFISCDDFPALCDFNLSYEDTSAFAAYNCRQALGFYTKAKFIDCKVDRRGTAVAKFIAAELKCTQVNETFRLRERGSFSFLPRVETVLFRAQQKIARVLGPVPRPEELKLRFGPGATTLTKKRQASTVEKLQAGLSCSEGIVPIAARLIEEMPHLIDLLGGPTFSRLSDGEECADVPLIIHEGVVEFVPKNAKTHRAIIKEPSLNSMVQNALGDHMERRLAAFGIDIRDQSINQRLALTGSLDGSLATLDLSSASDTISTELVASLLPIDWFILLDMCRSKTVVLDGETLCLEKFSSMGNGFTFPLETLIFWALASSVPDAGLTSVYGDDIIVETHCVQDVINILVACGFEINQSKSYWAGPFRESCGADYLRGIDIRPYYQKDLVSPAGLFLLHNYYVRKGDIDRAALVREHINPYLRIFGPDGYGDGHLLGDWQPRPHKRARSHGYGGVIFETFSRSGRRDQRTNRPGDRVLPLYTIYRREAEDDVLDNIKDVRSRLGFLRILRAGRLCIPGLPLPEARHTGVKSVSLPGWKGYKKIAIYTFNTA